MKLNLTSILTNLLPDEDSLNIKYQSLKERYLLDQDPWGLDLDIHKMYFKIFYPIYKNYFRVRVWNAERIENKPYVLVANHSGQIAIDGLLIMMAFIDAVSPPRVVRGMIERFLPPLPFLGEMIAQTGSILGDRKNCMYLLEKGETILVFPEGVRGIAKDTKDHYHLQDFTTGFLRMALRAKVDILPMAIVGAEEFYPFVFHLKKLANFLGLPALPITPTFPLLGPLGALPLPSPVDIYIGNPYQIPKELSPEAPDKEIDEHVHRIEEQINKMMKEGLKRKRNYLGQEKHAK